MVVRVGLIGAGIMGADHAHIFANSIHGAELTVVCDADPARAARVADACRCPEVKTDPLDVIRSTSVDAVVIASPDETHSPLVLTCLTARKPVLCEKPLSQSGQECFNVIGEEVKLGRKLVQIGFMRRFDQSYVEMKKALKSRKIGRAQMLHCFHRNVSAPANFTGQMAITNSAPHEFDIARFLLDTEFRSISVFQPRLAQARDLLPPVFMVAETAQGQLVNIEINNNAGYGYDVRGEIVGETGSVSMRVPSHSSVDMGLANSTAYATDWRPRFAEAYRRQNQAWIDAMRAGASAGASAWDGLCASVVAETAVKALQQGTRAEVVLPDKPALYGGQ